MTQPIDTRNPHTLRYDTVVDPLTGPWGPAHWIDHQAYFDTSGPEGWWVNPNGTFYRYQVKKGYSTGRAGTAYLVDNTGRWWEWGPTDVGWVAHRPEPYRGHAPLFVFGGFAIVVFAIAMVNPAASIGGIVVAIVLGLAAVGGGKARTAHPLAYDVAVTAGGVWAAHRMTERYR